MVKQHTKIDEARSYDIVIKRKAGIFLTWLILKVFPSVSANFITLCMFPLNILAAGILYYSIILANIPFLLIAFCITFLTLALDSVDGNIARIKKSSSIKGVYYDRLVHNISYPLSFFVLGFAMYASSDQLIYLIVLIIVAIFSELSPLDVSQKDVEALFIRQAVLNTTKNYDYKTHRYRKEILPESINHNNKIKKSIKTVLSNEAYYVFVLVDMILFESQFYFTCLVAFIHILGMIYVRSNIKRWESNLSEVLEQIYRQKEYRE